MDITLLKKLGFSEKAALLYKTLLQKGPSSVRALAEECKLNRGTTYDALKWLQEEKVVSFYKDDTKQLFVAEDPEVLRELVDTRNRELQHIDQLLLEQLPELKAVHASGKQRPLAQYIDPDEIQLILEDVLRTCEMQKEHEYRVYSAEGVKPFLYEQFPSFSSVRILKGIKVKAIALGKGGELRGLDERKWLPGKNKIPTYIFIYPGKTASISLNESGEPIGVIVANQGIFETQKQIFDTLWKTL